MRQLSKTHPEVYNAFMKGKHVVKRNYHNFTAVGVDMSLEQTINRSKKSSHGIIGNTKQKQFVAQWEITFHELLLIANIYREVTHSIPTTTYLHVHHEFSRSEIEHTEKIIVSMVGYVLSKENPFDDCINTSLHNLITQVAVANEAKEKLLNIWKFGNQIYEDFRLKRYIDKSARIWDTIHCTRFPTFVTLPKSSVTKGKAKKLTDMKTSASRIVQIAQLRGYELQRLFQYELSEHSMLFDEHGLLIKAKKSTLMQELEATLKDTEDVVFQPDKNTCFIIDAMNCLRKLATKDKNTFGDVTSAYGKYTSIITSHASRIDHVFDSYHECSPKDSERLYRQTNNVIDFAKITSDVRLPIQMDTFWPSSTNKLFLQQHVAESSKSLLICQPSPQLHTYSAFSGSPPYELTVNCTSVLNGVLDTHPSIDNFSIEEADFRMMVHAKHAAKQGLSKIVFVSSDTDIMVLSLFHWKKLHNFGVHELWLRTGVGDSTRLIPIHTLAEKLGSEICSVLPALHALSGADYTSKFGTKKAALNSNPTMFLKGFGTPSNKQPCIHDHVLKSAEEYLVQMLKKGTSCKTLDEFRLWKYVHGKNVSLDDLPPTSSSARGHISRALFHTHMQINCMEETLEILDPLKYGFEIIDNILMPSKCIVPFPNDFVGACSCIKCATSLCQCKKFEVSCCLFCKCKSVADDKIDCRNPYK